MLRFISPLVILGLMTSVAAANPSPSPSTSPVQQLTHRMKILLQDIGHKNEQAEVTLQPDESELKTIVTVTVHPSYLNELREDLTKSVNEYIDIHRGDCRANTTLTGTNAFALNAIHGGVSTTYVDVPLSTLAGHGNVITTHAADGTVINCGAI